LVEEDGTTLSVREEVPDRLPSFCPERHINQGGTFCLGFPAVDQLEVTDTETALRWLEIVWKFLKLQERAARLRRWPDDKVWAHGNAAQHQRIAQHAAAALSKDFSLKLESQRLRVERFGAKSERGPTIRAYVDGHHLFSVWERTGIAVRLKQRCFCGTSGKRTPKRLRACADHAKQASQLAVALHKWTQAEASFWKSFEGQPCCGSCNQCPFQR
jgi:hypothetical protein